MNIRMDSQSCRELGAATNVFRARAQALNQLAGSLDASFVDFARALSVVRGRIVVVGTGPSDCAARHMARLLFSMGIPALHMTPEAFEEGASWLFTPDDAVLAFSDGAGGYFLENVALSAALRDIGLFVVAGPGERVSPAARQVVRVPGTSPAAGEPFVAPLVRMALADALALGLMRYRGVEVSACGAVPAGGGHFRRVGEIMRTGAELPLLKADATLAQARLLLRRHAPCVVGVLKRDRLSGVVSDADFRRMGSRVDMDAPVTRAMRAPAATLQEDSTVSEALLLLRESGAPALFVLRDRRPIGLVGPYDCFRA